MADLTLIIGNRNYSSWSLRAYLALQQAGASYDELLIPLHTPGYKEKIVELSPSGHVPALHDGTIRVWDSLAIIEHLAETFPDAGLWPKDVESRCVARSISAEMHAGFMAVRSQMPLDMRGTHPRPAPSDRLTRELDRIMQIWTSCLAREQNVGPYLFGSFCAADAMFAPIVSRFRTYGIPLEGACQAYAVAIWNHPPMRTWFEAAQQESWTIEHR